MTSAAISQPPALRDWCETSGTDTAYIEPGAPWRTAGSNRSTDACADECPNIEDFVNLLESRVVLEDWRHDYNHHRPHRSLRGLTPAAYAASHRHENPTTKHP